MKKTFSATNLRSVPGYGFRPRRSPHQALDALFAGITKRKVNWIIDADIRGFFDNISHEWLIKFLEHRIANPGMLRLLKKWLRAGVSDARKCLAALKERFAKFGLELHPDKTRLIEFGRYAEERRAKRGDSPPETFDFLGFTYISGKTRRGDFTIHRNTSRKKFQAKLATLKEQLLRRRHDDLAEVGAWLQTVFRGWCQYYAVPGNYTRLKQFRDAIQAQWLCVLRRRSQRGRHLTWDKFSKLCKR